MLKIGIVGHRFLESEAVCDFVSKQCSAILKDMKERFKNVLALSAIAEGADMIFAQEAHSLHIPFEIIRPFEEYVLDFGEGNLRSQYLHLQKMAVKETKLPYACRSEEAYYSAMKWVVKNSHLLLAVWNGGEGNGKAGTAAAVELACVENRNWIHIDVTNKDTKMYMN